MSKRSGETVLITGASSGIGKATALYLAEKGFAVIGTSRSQERLTELQREASERGVSVTGVEMDINSDADVGRVVPALIEERGAIDALVNNAGYGLWGPVQELSVAELKAQFETNFFAAIRMIHSVLPGMVEKGSGTIVNIGSIAGRIGIPFNGAYAASKFALEGASESLRAELWPLGVRVTVVEPGLFRTDFVRNQVVAEGIDERESAYSRYIERYRARRARFHGLAGDPIKVARVVHKILRSRRPAFRYTVGTGAWLGVLGARLLPERLFQAMVSRVTMR